MGDVESKLRALAMRFAMAAGVAAAGAAAPTTAPAVSAVHIANDAFTARGPADEFLNEVDPHTLRTPASAPAGHIKSLIPNIPRDGHYTDLASIQATRVYISPLDKVRGKRIRISAWLKTNDVRECAGLVMYAYSDDGLLLCHDDMACVRPIHGTTDWQQYQMVQDIPQYATKIFLGATLFCAGEIWVDDFQIAVVPNEVPLTDNQDWQIFSPVAGRYTAAIDPAVQHDGHPATCLESSTVLPRGWALYGHYQMPVDPKFISHRIRITGWMKSSGVKGGSGFKIMTFTSLEKQLTDEGQRGHRPIVGTHDWQQYSALADVPPETKSIYWAISMNDRGKIWIDLDSIKIDLADDAASPSGGQGL